MDNSQKNKIFIFFVLCIGIVAAVSTWVLSSFISLGLIIIINAYLTFLLISAARLSADSVMDRDKLLEKFPTRVMGLALFFFFFVIIVHAFSNLYLAYGQRFNEPLVCRLDAICLSFGTMTTISIVNFTPAEACTKLLMMFQIISTILLFFAAFPLLLSRLGGFEDKLSATKKEKQNEGG